MENDREPKVAAYASVYFSTVHSKMKMSRMHVKIFNVIRDTAVIDIFRNTSVGVERE